jgi:hypothetical protein
MNMEIGDIYRVPIKTFHVDGTISWDAKHLLVVKFYPALPFRPAGTDKVFDTAARCLVLESGELQNMYVDSLLIDGEKIT